MTKVAMIVGSLRKESYNRKLSVQVKNILEKDFSENIGEVKILEIGEFPLFNQDMENNFPEVVTNFKKEIESSDKIIFITPEYNRSIPGVLKNAIDWASRPYGQNSFSGKKVLCMGVSSGKLGTVSVQNHLKQILVYLNCVVIGQPEIYIGPISEVFDEAKQEYSEKTLEIVKKGLQVLLA